jgi:hypothetical protein
MIKQEKNHNLGVLAASFTRFNVLERLAQVTFSIIILATKKRLPK